MAAIGTPTGTNLFTNIQSYERNNRKSKRTIFNLTYKNMEYIKFNCIKRGNVEGFEISTRGELPKKASLIDCGHEILENGLLGRTYCIYLSASKINTKIFVKFDKN